MPSVPDQDTRDMIETIKGLPGLNYRHDQGFASTFADTSARDLLFKYSPVLPLGAAAAGLWYLNSGKKKKKPTPKAALTKTAAPDIGKILESIRYHLPSVDIRDTGIGMAGGAGAGLLYDLIRGKGKDGKGKRLKRMLTGSLLGAGLGNLAGDRVRRYVSNTVFPMNYDDKKMRELIPGTRFEKDKDGKEIELPWTVRNAVKDIWEGAIKDKPIYKRLNTDGFRSNYMTPARRELVRRSFGLPLDRGVTPVWQKNKDGTYSLNEKNPGYDKFMRALFGPLDGLHKTYQAGNASGRGPAGQIIPGQTEMLKDPVGVLSGLQQSKGQRGMENNARMLDMFGQRPLMGDSQLPYKILPDGSVRGQMLDRWDLTLDNKERGVFSSGWDAYRKGGFKGLSEWGKKPVPAINFYMGPDTHTNAAAAKTLAGRWGWDNLLAKELPWVRQRFEFAKQPDRTWKQYWNMDAKTYADAIKAPYHFQFLKEDNSPATPEMDYNKFVDWVQNFNYKNTPLSAPLSSQAAGTPTP